MSRVKERAKRLTPAALAASVLASGILVGTHQRSSTTARADEPNQAVVKSHEVGLPKGWFGGSASAGAYESGIDRTVVHGGKVSAFIRMNGAGQGDFGTLMQTIQAEPYHGRRVRLAAYLKTEGAREGAALWMRVDGKDATLAFDNMDSRRIRGTTDWRKAEVVLDVSERAEVIAFGMLLSGSGKAWADDFQLEAVGKDIPSTNMFDKEQKADFGIQIGAAKPENLDFEEGIGVPGMTPSPLAVEAKPLTKEQKEWLRTVAIPFDTAEPGRGFADLQRLRVVIGAARIVALGEATHGTSEFFKMKHRLTEFLATEMGFTRFAIEANMPEAYRVNEYVLTGKGDPKELLRGMYFWTWDTQEVLDMILWMRRFNESGKGRIQFLGFDMQFGLVALANVRGFVARADPDYARDLERAYEGLGDSWGTPERMRAARGLPAKEKAARTKRAWGVVQHLEASRAG
jgi:erythromycin esterase